MWQWYARTLSWSDSPALTLPFMSYDIDVTRNVFANGSVTFDATATATLGLLSHGDAVRGEVSRQRACVLCEEYERACPCVYAHAPLSPPLSQSNYYGWGDFASETMPHLAACGDLYAATPEDLFELFHIAQVCSTLKPPSPCVPTCSPHSLRRTPGPGLYRRMGGLRRGWLLGPR